MKLPPQSRFDWRYGLRRLRSRIGRAGATLVRFKLPLAVLSLATLGGLVVVLSGPGRSFELHLSTLVPVVGVVGAVLIVASAVIRKLDELSRDHVGGAWVTDLSILAEDTPGFSSRLLGPGDATGLRLLSQFAERTYAGTMAAGVGGALSERVQNRQSVWGRRLEVNPDCIAYALDREGVLAALTMLYPLADATYEDYRLGKLDYIKLTPEQLTPNPSPDGAGTAQQLYVSACLGDRRSTRLARRAGHDLVGRLLVQHLGTVMERIHAEPTKTRIVTDGLTGKNLESFRRKGFATLGAKDRNGCPILELRPASDGVAPAELVGIAVRAPRLTAAR